MPGPVRGEVIVARLLIAAALLWGAKRTFKGRHERFQARHAARHHAVAELQLRAHNRVGTREGRIAREHLQMEIVKVERRGNNDSVEGIV